MNIGPDLWGNASDGSSPVEEITAWLGEMRLASESWKESIRARNEYWDGKINALVTQINGLEAAISGDVFLSKLDRASYDVVCNSYQSLKDSLTLSSDFYLTEWQQNLNNPDSPWGAAGDFLDKLLAQLQALLRQLFGGAGVVIGGAIVIGLLYLYVKGK